jgi:hypothetical protein
LSIRFDFAASSRARRTFGALLFVLMFVCLRPAASSALTLPASFTDETVVTGVDRPTAVAFTPDARVLIGAEHGLRKAGRVRALTAEAAPR